jgi:hypothetical protein
MNIKSRPLMIGAGVAAAIQILFSLCNQVVTYFQLQSLGTLNLDPNATTIDPGQLSSLGTYGLIGILICCLTLASDIIGGYLYSHLHANEDPLLQMQDGLVGGAVTGLVARIISSLFGVCIGLIMSQLILADFYADLGGAAATGAGIGSIIGGGVGGIIGVCISSALGLFLGAIGGAIGASVRGRK